MPVNVARMSFADASMVHDYYDDDCASTDDEYEPYIDGLTESDESSDDEAADIIVAERALPSSSTRAVSFKETQAILTGDFMALLPVVVAHRCDMEAAAALDVLVGANAERLRVRLVWDEEMPAVTRARPADEELHSMARDVKQLLRGTSNRMQHATLADVAAVLDEAVTATTASRRLLCIELLLNNVRLLVASAEVRAGDQKTSLSYVDSDDTPAGRNLSVATKRGLRALKEAAIHALLYGCQRAGFNYAQWVSCAPCWFRGEGEQQHLLLRDTFMLPVREEFGVNISGCSPYQVEKLAAAKQGTNNKKLRVYYPALISVGVAAGTMHAGSEAKSQDAAVLPIFDGCLYQKTIMNLARISLFTRQLRKRALSDLNKYGCGVFAAVLKPLPPDIAATAAAFAAAARSAPSDDVVMALHFADVAAADAAEPDEELSLPEVLRKAYRELRA